MIYLLVLLIFGQLEEAWCQRNLYTINEIVSDGNLTMSANKTYAVW